MPHRVAVGASGSSPEIHATHTQHGDAYTPDRNAGDLPVAPTLHVWTIQRIVKHRYASPPVHCMYVQSNALQNTCNASPRSCRGEWKLARNTRNTYTKRRRIHAR